MASALATNLGATNLVRASFALGKGLLNACGEPLYDEKIKNISALDQAHAREQLEHDDKLAPWVGLCLEPIEVLQF